MKPLYPTLKEKKRYLLIKIISDNKFGFSTIKKEIKKNLKELLGEFELAKAGLIFFRETWNNKSKTFIVRVGNKHLNKFKGAITLIKNIKKEPVIVSSLKTSGKLKNIKYFQEKVN